MEQLKLNDGNSMPNIGFGTWHLTGQKGQDSVAAAINAGYKLIDTAKIYGNEQEVGRAIDDSGKREELFITTKLWTSDQGFENAMVSFDESLERLGLEDVDLYLIHWPGHNRGKRLESWRALVEINGLGSAKSVGVSNFKVEHLQELVDKFDQLPAVNQIEFHPFVYGQQKEILDFCQKHNITVEAYSPLAQASQMKNPVIQNIAEDLSRTPAQVMLRWAIQHGTVPIPRSSNTERIKQNLEVFDFELSREQMDKLNSL